MREFKFFILPRARAYIQRLTLVLYAFYIGRYYLEDLDDPEGIETRNVADWISTP